MSPHQVVAVAVRLFAVWLAVYVLRTVPAFYLVGNSVVPPGYLFLLIFFILLGALVLALWFFPRTVAGKLLSSPVVEQAPPASPDMWLAMGCALIGLWVLSTAVATLISNGFAFYSVSSNFDDTTGVKRWLIHNLVEVVIGVWLIFGARGFRRVFWWARNAGTSKPSN